MSETYCGKSCAECLQKEQLACPGCMNGPGKRFGDCDLAKCCQDKHHETCETCMSKNQCGLLRGKERMPERRMKRLEEEKQQRQAAARRAPILGRWLTVLFWLLIPSLLASVLQMDALSAAVPGLKTPGLLLQLAVFLGQALILLRLSQVDESYRTAFWCYLIGGGVGVVLDLITGGNAGQWTVVLTVPAGIVSIVGKYHEFTAHSNALYRIDDCLAWDWLGLRKWYVMCYAVVVGAVVLAIISPILGILAIIAGGIGMVVVGISELYLLYQTAARFRAYAADCT